MGVARTCIEVTGIRDRRLRPGLARGPLEEVNGRMRGLAVGCFLTLAAGLAAPRGAAGGDPPASPLTDADRAFFAWWDGLG